MIFLPSMTVWAIVLTTFLGCLTAYILIKNKTQPNNSKKKRTSTYETDYQFKSASNQIVQSNGKLTRVYVDGCWDVMHSGHYNALRQAKALGDILVVGVHSDDEIKLHKREPVMNNEQRMAAVRACKWADEVEFGVPYVVSAELLSELNCDYVAHGDDIPIAANGHSAYHTVMDKLKIFRRTPGVSTTHLIQRLLEAAKFMESKGRDPTNEISVESNPPKLEQTDNNNTKIENAKEASWSSFLSSASRLRAFSNNRTPSKDDVVVYIDGVFDLFHIGHINALKAAKESGTFLYVGVYDDETVQQRLGKYFPLMNLQERVLNVLSCKYVDDVIIGAPWEITKQVLNVMNITYVAMTVNTAFAQNEMDRYDTAKEMGIFRELKTKSSYTTRDLIGRIVQQKQTFENENAEKIKKTKNYEANSAYMQETRG